MKTFKHTIITALLPLLGLNLAGLAAGGAWLGVMSQWQVIWIGVLMIFFSPYIIPILMLPAGIFSHFMTLYHTAGRRGRERLMYVCSISYILLFLTLWCVVVFEYVTQSVSPGAMGAALLWASTSALAPLLMWASRDRHNIFIAALVEVAQVAVLILCAVRISGIVTSFWMSFGIIGGIMAFVVIVRAIYEGRSALTGH